MWIGEHEVDLHVVIDGKQADSFVHLGVQGVRMEEIARWHRGDCKQERQQGEGT